MRIGEVARRAGLRSSAIRFYEQIGLLAEPDRTPAGYRDYGVEVLGRLEFIQAGRALGLSLAELRDIIEIRQSGQAPCTHALGLIEQRIDEIGHRIHELETIRADLTALLVRTRTADPAACLPSRVCEVIAPSAHPAG